MAKNHVHRGLVFSAAAIAVVYAAGYVHTQAADAALGATDTAITSQPAPAGTPPQTTTPAPVASSNRQPTAKSTAPSTTQIPAAGSATGQITPTSPKPAFKDGTYTGVGNSRRGGVQVFVAVQGGRIATVNITRVSTEYPPTDIAPLLPEVVSRQSAQLDFVSGATYSSMAFRAAVQRALSKAQS